MKKSKPKISVVTHLKGRTNYWIGGLASVLNQTERDLEYIIVDWGCNQNVGDFVYHHFDDERIQIIKTGINQWNNSRAKNLGGATAMGEYILFLDGDKALAPNFIETVLSHASDQVYFTGWKNSIADAPKELAIFIVKNEHFRSVKGFNQLIKGWGWEDFDIFYRLQHFLGLKSRTIPLDLVWNLDSPDFVRLKHIEISSIEQGHNENMKIFRERFQGYDEVNIVFDEPLYDFNNIHSGEEFPLHLKTDNIEYNL